MIDQSSAQEWEAAVQQCMENIEPDDRRQIEEVNTYKQLQSEVQHHHHGLGTSPDEARRLLPTLNHLRIFAMFFSEGIGSEAHSRPLWGFLSLAIKLAENEEPGLSRMTQMLRPIGKKAEIFNEYCKRDLASEAIQEATLEAHITLLRLYANIVQSFRKGSAARGYDSVWEPLVDIFHEASHELDQALSRIEKLAKISKEDRHTDEVRRLHDFLSASSEHPRSAAETAKDDGKFPCIVLPSSTFFFNRSYNREEILDSIQSHLKSGLSRFCSIALHGVGGVGKSHIAHKYAYMEGQKRTYDAVFWIRSDTPSAIEQSFTDVAVRLQLSGASIQNHTENKIRVLTWLQQTGRPWLVIFDNAEDPGLLTDYWPSTGRGHAIVTTRNHSLAFDLADKNIEVPSFEPDGGSKLLLQLLSLDVTSEIADTEVKSALELSEKLRGHALAISQMAGLIHRRSWTIEEFLSVYEKSTQEVHQRALDAVWRLSFENLHSDSSELLGVLSFVAPDSIPQALFEPEKQSQLPATLRFCADDIRLSDVLEPLMTLALVKRDKDLREFFVHRLVQAQFIYFMSFPDRQRAFWNAAKLLFNVFPASGGRLGQLYAHWGTCRQYLQHVLTLASHYRESNKPHASSEDREDERLQASQPFCWLLVYCCRYLIEQVYLEELAEMSKLAIEAYDALIYTEKDLYLEGLLQNQYAFSWYLQGNFQLAEVHWQKGLDLHEQIEPPAHRAVCWRSYNMGLVLAATERYEDAIKCYLYSEKRWAQSGDENLACVAMLRSQRAQALTFVRRLDEAKVCFDFAILHLKGSKEWGWLAFAYFAEGNYYRELSQHRTAENKFKAAQEAWRSGDQTRMHNFYAACLFKLGCVALDQGSFETAREFLQHARTITRLKAQMVPADYKRVLNKLYQLSTLMPGQDFDSEVTLQGQRLFEQTFGVQADTSFVARERKFDSLVNCNWR